MALDPRLASLELLAIAAKRAKSRAAQAPQRFVTLQIIYDAAEGEPEMLGERHTIALPADPRP